MCIRFYNWPTLITSRGVWCFSAIVLSFLSAQALRCLFRPMVYVRLLNWRTKSSVVLAPSRRAAVLSCLRSSGSVSSGLLALISQPYDNAIGDARCDGSIPPTWQSDPVQQRQSSCSAVSSSSRRNHGRPKLVKRRHTDKLGEFETMPFLSVTLLSLLSPCSEWELRLAEK